MYNLLTFMITDNILSDFDFLKEFMACEEQKTLMENDVHLPIPSDVPSIVAMEVRERMVAKKGLIAILITLHSADILSRNDCARI